MYSCVMTVTPELAKEWLAKNIENNRGISLHRVKRFAEDMRGGYWKLNSESITFDLDGNLVNGQHRLSAVVEAKIPVEMYVTFDCPESTIYDFGRTRTLNDQLKMSGRKHPNYEVAAARFLVCGLCGVQSDGVVRGIVERDEMKIANQLTGSGNRIARKAGAMVAGYVAMKNGLSERMVCRFYTVVNTGLYNPGEEAAVFYRNKLIEYRDKVGSNRANFDFDLAISAILDFASLRERKIGYSEKTIEGKGRKYFEGTLAESYVRNLIRELRGY